MNKILLITAVALTTLTGTVNAETKLKSEDSTFIPLYVNWEVTTAPNAISEKLVYKITTSQGTPIDGQPVPTKSGLCGSGATVFGNITAYIYSEGANGIYHAVCQGHIDGTDAAYLKVNGYVDPATTTENSYNIQCEFGPGPVLANAPSC